jgi:2-hydroxychromene-2-carboxylate isomerase
MTDSAAPPIGFYFDLRSPYAYLGSVLIARMAAKHGRAIDWRPVLIGVTVMRVMGMKPVTSYPLKGPYLAMDLHRLARLHDIPIAQHGIEGVVSLNAMRAFCWLKERDAELAVRFARRMFERLWVEGFDITAADTVADEAATLGIAHDAALAALSDQAVKDNLRTAVDEAMAAGVFGVPTFLVDGELIWGSDRMWMVEHWLTHHSWEAPAR